jgi:sulfite exporter TauE/SafE
MCGPIAFVLPVDRNNPVKKSFQILLYHLGRLFAYACIGLIFGLIGEGINLFGAQQQLSIGIGLLMIIVILIPIKTFNKYNFSKPVYRLISKVKSALGRELKKKSPDVFLSIGFLNGFLPCGLVYMAVFGALTFGNAIEGSIYMILFGIGTIPLMTMTVYLGNFLSGKIKKHIRKSIPVFIFIMASLFILRGMGLGIPYISPMPMVENVESSIECSPSFSETNE